MSAWTTEQVEAMAPDAASAKAGRGLAAPGKWPTLGRSDSAAWGECQGSGKKPYQVRIDLREPAFKCSCPSRKFPCKHAIGLFLMLAERPASLAPGEPPDWVSEWLSGRDARAERKAERAEAPRTTAADPEARAKRLERRETRVSDGVERLQLWLDDLASSGLASAQALPYAEWDRMAAAMVDAQAPGLARLVREASALAHSGAGWEGRLLAHLGRVQLVLDAWRRVESLPPELRADVRAAVGFTVEREEVEAAEGVTDRWFVAGQQLEDDGTLKTRSTWLWGERCNEPALVLDFSAGGRPFGSTFAVGSRVEGEVVYYPGAARSRAIVRSVETVEARGRAPAGLADFEEMATHAAGALARAPWMATVPVLCGGVRVTPGDAGAATLADADGRRLPIAHRFTRGWDLLAIAGEEPATVFGVWDGDAMFPIAAGVGGEMWGLDA